MNKRDEIIETTCNLLEFQGYHATGLNQIIRESRAPKGSLYHYFPEGKEELAAEAIRRSGEGIAGNIGRALSRPEVGGDPAAAVTAFIRELAGYVAASGFRQGGPITAVALEAASTNERLRLTCRDAYRSWRELFVNKLRDQYGDERAGRLATLIIAAIEGGIILARSEQSPRPLLDVADEIERLLTSV
jgi:TetR/AcrR family transcriptional repressor of lmrAB and yxaGH operons